MLTRLVPDIQKTADLVKEIASASSKQNQGAISVNSAITNLDSAIQQNATAAEELASSSTELNIQGQEMQHAMSFFNVGNQALAQYVQRAVQRPAPQALPQPTPKSAPSGVNITMEADDEFEKL